MNKSTPDNIVVTWDAVQNASSYEISYAVKWDSTNGFVYDKDLAYIKEDVSASKTSYAFKQILDPSAGYYIKIQAKGDNATYSDSVWGSETATTKELTQLTAPNVTASSTASTFTLNWNPVANANGYKVECDGQTTQTVAATEYVFTGLNSNSSYKVSVTALGNGEVYRDSVAWSDDVSTTDKKSLKTPSLTGEGFTASTITVSWNGVANVDQYELKIDPARTDGKTSFTYGALRTDATLTDLEPNTSYTLSIRAKAPSGNPEYQNSEWSNPIEVTTKELRRLDRAVFNSHKAASQTSIAFSWNRVENADYYTIKYALDGTSESDTDKWKVLTTSEVAYTVEGLTYGEFYTFSLQAHTNNVKEYADSEVTTHIYQATDPPKTGASNSPSNSSASLFDEFDALFDESDSYFEEDDFSNVLALNLLGV